MAVIARRDYRDKAVRDDDAADTEVVATDGLSTGQVILARVIWFVTGIILTLLAFRFVFALLGANPNNAIADFIYSTSQPFVSPFFGLFNYNVVNLGASRFEIFTLVAMAAYAIIGWLLVRLATLNRRF